MRSGLTAPCNRTFSNSRVPVVRASGRLTQPRSLLLCALGLHSWRSCAEFSAPGATLSPLCFAEWQEIHLLARVRKLRYTLTSLGLKDRRPPRATQPAMSMSPKEVENIAQELLTARETGQMVSVPPSERPGFDLDTAYQVEAALKKFREAAGHCAAGQKVGYANKAMWRILKLETLVWAHMYDDTIHYSDRNSAALSVAHPRSLKIEPEIVFGLRVPASVEGAPDAAAPLTRTEWLTVGL